MSNISHHHARLLKQKSQLHNEIYLMGMGHPEREDRLKDLKRVLKKIKAAEKAELRKAKRTHQNLDKIQEKIRKIVTQKEGGNYRYIPSTTQVVKGVVGGVLTVAFVPVAITGLAVACVTIPVGRAMQKISHARAAAKAKRVAELYRTRLPPTYHNYDPAPEFTAYITEKLALTLPETRINFTTKFDRKEDNASSYHSAKSEEAAFADQNNEQAACPDLTADSAGPYGIDVKLGEYKTAFEADEALPDYEAEDDNKAVCQQIDSPKPVSICHDVPSLDPEALTELLENIQYHPYRPKYAVSTRSWKTASSGTPTPTVNHGELSPEELRVRLDRINEIFDMMVFSRSIEPFIKSFDAPDSAHADC